MLSLTTPPRRVIASLVALSTVPAIAVVAHQSTATGAESITLQYRPGSFKFVDVPPKAPAGDEAPPSPGDYFALTNKLFQGGERVGTLFATCIFTNRAQDPARIALLCTGAYDLPGGRIVGSALLKTDDQVNHIVLTGGTGRYAGMSGSATEYPDDSGGDSGRVVIKLHQD